MGAYKTTRLVWTFYMSFALASMVITGCCLKLLWDSDFSIFAPLFWFKIATLGLICYFIHGNKTKQYYYYHNLRLSKLFLWATTLIFDFCLFLSLVMLAYKIK